MAFNYAALKAEIAADPMSRGYSTMTDQAVADSMNAVNRNRNRTSISGAEIAASITEADWNRLTDPVRQRVLALLGIDALDPFGFAAIELKKAFGQGSATVTALAAARVESVSRATELGLPAVKAGWVGEVRR